MSAEQWNQQQYMQDQCEEIQRHKWIESEKAGRDLGYEAVRQWISKYAKLFWEAACKSGRYGCPPK